MIRKVLIAALLLCGFAAAQPAQGKFSPNPGELRGILPPGRWWKSAEIARSVGLTDAQVQKIEQVFQENRLKLVDIHANLQKEEIKLEPMLEAENPDESAVLSSIDRIAAARATLEKANAQMAFAIRRVLTPEQWKKLREMRPARDHFPPPAEGPRELHHRERSLPSPAGAQAMPPLPPPPPEGAGDAAPGDQK